MTVKSAERLLRTALREFEVRFQVNEKVLGSSPSLVQHTYKVAIFVDGCQESYCPWHCAKKRPVTLWKRLNDRDARLRKEGWTVVRVWQHEVEAAPKMAAGRIAMIVRTVREVNEKTKSKKK